MKNILILNVCDTGNEAEALRQVLEYMNFFVGIKKIGRPKDFIDSLSGKLPFDPDCVIISCHGEDGKILMPILGESVYFDDEPRGAFSCKEIERCLKMSDKLIVSTGCTTGENDIGAAFSQRNNYIAPSGYIEGDSALFFVIRLFYNFVRGKNINDAFLDTQATDSETEMFRFFKAIPQKDR